MFRCDAIYVIEKQQTFIENLTVDGLVCALNAKVINKDIVMSMKKSVI